MKIVEFIFRLGAGGAEVFVMNLSKALVARGHDVEIVTLFKEREGAGTVYEPFLDDKVKIHKFDFDQGFSLFKVRAVCDYITNLAPDVVHCHLNVIPYIYPIAFCKNKVKFIHTLHSLANNLGTSGLTKTLARFFYKTDRIQPIAISKLCADSLKQYYNITNVTVIDNGCNPVRKTSLFENVLQEVESYKRSANTPVFIHVARSHPLKRQDRLVAAFNKLYAEGVDFILLVIGRGFDTEESAAYVSTACKNIHFLGQKGNVADYLYCSDAFCLTSEVEGLPISLLEALSVGVCPICTPVGGMLDVVYDGENGYLSNTEEVDDYCFAIKRYLNNSIDKRNLLDTFAKRYSMNICCNNYVQQFESKR